MNIILKNIQLDLNMINPPKLTDEAYIRYLKSIFGSFYFLS